MERKKPLCLKAESPAHCELGSTYIRQIQKEFQALYTTAVKGAGIRASFFRTFRRSNFPGTFVERCEAHAVDAI